MNKLLLLITLLIFVLGCDRKNKDGVKEYYKLIKSDGRDLIDNVNDCLNHLKTLEESEISLKTVQKERDSVLFYYGKLEGVKDAQKLLLSFSSVYK